MLSRRAPPDVAPHDELRDVAGLRFRYAEEEPEMDYTRRLAIGMQALGGVWVVFGWSPLPPPFRATFPTAHTPPCAARPSAAALASRRGAVRRGPLHALGARPGGATPPCPQDHHVTPHDPTRPHMTTRGRWTTPSRRHHVTSRRHHVTPRDPT
eukprot:1513101-Prymnesium_polylepis.1